MVFKQCLKSILMAFYQYCKLFIIAFIKATSDNENTVVILFISHIRIWDGKNLLG